MGRRKGEQERSCRLCGCTDRRACRGGCHWVDERLCSACSTDAETTYMALQLVGGTEHITESQVKGWTQDERADSFNWAMCVHAYASDNYGISVPARPSCTLPVSA
jgi:hypothetical protein